jgi:hypothetical protein
MHLIAWLVLSPAILLVLIGALVVRAQAESRLSHPTPGPREIQP